MHHLGTSPSPRLLLVAHGTASAEGSATTRRLADAVRAARPELDVRLCFLDVDTPSLPDSLDQLDQLAELDARPTVLVPLLLSTGYHVQTDIPDAVAGHPHVRVARHLGPHPLLVDALVDRLPSGEFASTVLLGTGSSRPEAATELAETAALLGRRLGTSVDVATMADELDELFSTLPSPARVATYLLSPGRFVDVLHAGAARAGRGTQVAEPIGVHPALVDLVLLRYMALAGDR